MECIIIFKRIKDNKLAQTLGLSWLICMISHVIIPMFIAFPIFNHFFEHGHSSGSEIFLEMLIFTCLVVPVSLLVTFIHSKITKKKHCCDHAEHSLVCETCPHKQDAIEYVEKLQNEARKKVYK